MNQEWKTFLEAQGAIFVGSKLDYFESPETEQVISSQDTFLCAADDRSLIEVSGEDAESFLQNQLTNDIRNVTENAHQQSAWCNPKGRIIANFRIFKRDQSYFLSLSSDLVELVLKKLRMYVMMSKVTIEDVSENIVNLTFAGEGSETHLQELVNFGDVLSQNENGAFVSGSTTYLRIQGNTPRFEIFAEISDAKKIWNHCKNIAKPSSGTAWKYLNIISGIPEITAASSESWIPQMVNYIHIGGVDFKKGCYPGQEVVARLNYLGKTKRRMYHIEIDSNDMPHVSDSIKSESDKDAGKILNAVLNADNKVQALAVLKIASTSEVLKLVSNDASISLLDLPYEVEDE